MCTCNRDEYNDLYMLAMHADIKLQGCDGGERVPARHEKLAELNSPVLVTLFRAAQNKRRMAIGDDALKCKSCCGDLEEVETDDCTCDICGATGTAYGCESGCGYDLCQSCWGGDDEAGEEATAALAAARQLHPEAEVRACAKASASELVVELPGTRHAIQLLVQSLYDQSAMKVMGDDFEETAEYKLQRTDAEQRALEVLRVLDLLAALRLHNKGRGLCDLSIDTLSEEEEEVSVDAAMRLFVTLEKGSHEASDPETKRWWTSAADVAATLACRVEEHSEAKVAEHPLFATLSLAQLAVLVQAHPVDVPREVPLDDVKMTVTLEPGHSYHNFAPATFSDGMSRRIRFVDTPSPALGLELPTCRSAPPLICCSRVDGAACRVSDRTTGCTSRSTETRRAPASSRASRAA